MQCTFIFRTAATEEKGRFQLTKKCVNLVQIFSVFIQAIQHKNITIYMINQNKVQPVYTEGHDFFPELIIALCCVIIVLS